MKQGDQGENPRKRAADEIFSACSSGEFPGSRAEGKAPLCATELAAFPNPKFCKKHAKPIEMIGSEGRGKWKGNEECIY